MPDAMKGTSDLTPIIAELKTVDDKNALFLASLMEKYQQSLSSYDAFKSIWGFGDDYKGMMYAQGLMPIVRFQVAGKAALSIALSNLLMKQVLRIQQKALKA